MTRGLYTTRWPRDAGEPAGEPPRGFAKRTVWRRGSVVGVYLHACRRSRPVPVCFLRLAAMMAGKDEAGFKKHVPCEHVYSSSQV